LMILHFSQIGLTDDLTFTVKSSFQKKSDYNYNIALVNLQEVFSINFQALKFLYGYIYLFGISSKLTVQSVLPRALHSGSFL